MATGGGLLHHELFSEGFPLRMGATSQHGDAKARTGGNKRMRVASSMPV